MKDRYLRQFDFLRDRIEVIYNGFDPERIGSRQETLFPQFTILHLGNFYAKQKTRDPSLFLSAIEKVVSEKKIPSDQLQVLFIGERYPEVEEMIENRGLSAHVTYLDRVPHDVAMDYLNKSHVLLLIEALDVMTTKVYEYLATGKPILCLIKQGGDLDSFIRTFSTNSTIIHSNNVDDIKESILKCYEDYQKGEYRSSVKEEFKNGFSRMEQTRHLAELLDKISLRDSSAR
jgi:glycosyltransferase involved in cell wall biosynthesis